MLIIGGFLAIVAYEAIMIGVNEYLVHNINVPQSVHAAGNPIQINYIPIENECIEEQMEQVSCY